MSYPAPITSIRPADRPDLADRDVVRPMRVLAATEMLGPVLQITRRQPQPLEMTLVADLNVVLIFLAAVQHMIVVDKLHLARRKIHIDVEARIARHLADRRKCLARGGRQSRRLGMLLRRQNVLRDEADEEPFLMLSEDREHVVGLGALGLLAARIVWHRLI